MLGHCHCWELYSKKKKGNALFCFQASNNLTAVSDSRRVAIISKKTVLVCAKMTRHPIPRLDNNFIWRLTL